MVVNLLAVGLRLGVVFRIGMRHPGASPVLALAPMATTPAGQPQTSKPPSRRLLKIAPSDLKALSSRFVPYSPLLFLWKKCQSSLNKMDSPFHDRIDDEPLLPCDNWDSDGNDGIPIPDLESSQHHGFYASSTNPSLPRSSTFLSRYQARQPSTVILLLAVLMFGLTGSAMLFMIPLFRLMEDALCHVHYQKHPSEHIDERLCKVDPVQAELAYLGGWSIAISALVNMVAALPYGILADR